MRKRLIQNNTITEEQFDLLVEAVQKGKNILVAGLVGSGKSTLLNVILATAYNKDPLEIHYEEEMNTADDYLNVVTKTFLYPYGVHATIHASEPEFIVQCINNLADESGLPHRADVFDLTVYIRTLADGSHRVTNIAPYPTLKQQEEANFKEFILKNYQEDVGDHLSD